MLHEVISINDIYGLKIKDAIKMNAFIYTVNKLPISKISPIKGVFTFFYQDHTAGFMKKFPSVYTIL